MDNDDDDDDEMFEESDLTHIDPDRFVAEERRARRVSPPPPPPPPPCATARNYYDDKEIKVRVQAPLTFETSRDVSTTRSGAAHGAQSSCDALEAEETEARR